MIGILAGAVTGFTLGFNGYTWTDGIFWATLVPWCMVGTGIDMYMRTTK